MLKNIADVLLPVLKLMHKHKPGVCAMHFKPASEKGN